MDIRDIMKPCPFCGARVETVRIVASSDGMEELSAECSCGANIDIEGDGFIYSCSDKIRVGKDALEKWNTREEGNQ